MKAKLCTIVALSILVCDALAQGSITFVSRSGTLRAPIYGPELDYINFGGDWANAKTGNTSSGMPSGSQVYNGAPLENFEVRFWAAPGIVTDGRLLSAGNVITATSSGLLAGFFPTTTVLFANLPSSGIATVQIRAYDPAATLDFGYGTAAVSALFTVDIGSIATGLRSFSAGWLDPATFAPYVPEPTIGSLLALAAGVVALRMQRRRNA